tara:strand:- start:1355 stop:1555 length:201 start_codon:yes stop_codon:yes gene_type:complete
VRQLTGAISLFEKLINQYDTYFLSTDPWDKASAWSDKNLWERLHLGESVFKGLVLTHFKNLILLIF